MIEKKANHLIDATGYFCPEPVMMLHEKINKISVGDIIKIIATDPSTKRDFEKFCHFLEHQLLHQEEENKKYIFFIEKKH